MDRRQRPDPTPTPTPKRHPHPPFSSHLHDISNYKTPRAHSRNPNPNPNPDPEPSPLFFTASKNTPYSSSRSSIRRHKPFTPSLPQSKAARKLKALQLQQSVSARKAETSKNKRIQSFARSITAWLNFLLENPKDCGCEVGVESDGGRGSKRQKSCEEEEKLVGLSGEKLAKLRESLKDVCSLDDLRERMEGHMSKKGCEEVLSMISRLCKVI